MMNPRTKQLLIAGGIIAVSGIALYFGYKFIRKEIIKQKLRKAQDKAEQEKIDSGKDDVNVTTPETFQQGAVGKTLYPKSDYVNVRSSAEVDNGMWGKTLTWGNNFIGKVVKGKAVGKVIEGNITGDGFVWYRISPFTANFTDSKELGSADKKATTGYVREDNVIVK